jgi:hypothetical protein
MFSRLVIGCVVAILSQAGRSVPADDDAYERLLRLDAGAAQQAALREVLGNRQLYSERIRRDLRNYTRDVQAWRHRRADRVVYLSTLMRDRSFAEILKDAINDPVMEDACVYDCPVVFALAIYAAFDGWEVPATLDRRRTAVGDLRRDVERLRHMSLAPESLEWRIGSGRDGYVSHVRGLSQVDLIRVAGSDAESHDLRFVAAAALSTTVDTSKHREGLYLLAMNELLDDSKEYRNAIYEAIYRAEKARANGR